MPANLTVPAEEGGEDDVEQDGGAVDVEDPALVVVALVDVVDVVSLLEDPIAVVVPTRHW
jgi:hypothetical protein